MGISFVFLCHWRWSYLSSLLLEHTVWWSFNIKRDRCFQRCQTWQTSFELSPFSIIQNMLPFALTFSEAEAECTTTMLGKDYRGRKSTTQCGRTCQRWDKDFPHEHTGQWSWTVRTENRMEGNSNVFHSIFLEHVNSNVNTHRGSNRHWSELISHTFNVSENYCRNPDDEPGGPWCYTIDEDVRWEYCGIVTCPGKNTIAALFLCHHPKLGKKQFNCYCLDAFLSCGNLPGK